MSILHQSPHPLAPHMFTNPRLSPSRSTSNMSGRKRKADSEEPDDGGRDRMSTSPSASPSIQNRPLRNTKRTRTGTAQGRPLPLPRLLQTMSADDMRQLLQNICDEHPELQQAIVTKAPRPSIDSALSVLSKYESAFQNAFPLGNRPTSDYAYNRVRQHLVELIDALKDFTPHFLPPQESQAVQSLNYLEAATNIIHRLPDWDTYAHQRLKIDSYDEIAKAWALVIREAAKRAGGIHLQMGGWDRKLVEHNNKSGERFEEAVIELKAAVGFPVQQTGGMGGSGSGTSGVSDERLKIREQLFGGTYGGSGGGQGLGVGQGRW